MDINKLNKTELDILIALSEQEKERVHQLAIRDAELRELEIDIDFITVKLKAQRDLLD